MLDGVPRSCLTDPFDSSERSNSTEDDNDAVSSASAYVRLPANHCKPVMYQAYWGLGESPFRGNLDPKFFHQGPSQEEALARLHFLVEERRALGLLLGTAGGGKSLLLDVFAKQLGIVSRQTAQVSLVGASAHDFLWSVCSRLGIEGVSQANNFGLWRGLTDHLIANRFQQIATILLLDDADEAHPDVIELVSRLAQFDTSREARLTVVLSAEPTRLHKLGYRLLELAELRIDLEGWETDDTAQFIKQALSKAGRTTPIFSDAALARLNELTGGIPRRVKQIADLALLAGAGRGVGQIEPDTIDSVFHELGVVAPEVELIHAAR